ncbi:hypothetical protein ACQEV4_31140 [Streptomyces shenzhenensis]|uniref:hypothetical protein n=1 Tax=Streptomyces shenzhenensis TaxID=943815 RepID=UPI003D9199B4
MSVRDTLRRRVTRKCFDVLGSPGRHADGSISGSRFRAGLPHEAAARRLRTTRAHHPFDAHGVGYGAESPDRWVRTARGIAPPAPGQGEGRCAP